MKPHHALINQASQHDLPHMLERRLYSTFQGVTVGMREKLYEGKDRKHLVFEKDRSIKTS